MAGLYVHIPFCRKKCHYCNFYSLASKRYHAEVFAALLDEISLRKDYAGAEPFQTVYFGGGTPSLFSPQQIDALIHQAEEQCGIAPDAEITLEANPDDICESWLEGISKTAVNRLSLGIQSFRDEDLKMLNRSHSARQAMDAVHQLRSFGFDNISIDLIFGIPGLGNEHWKANLETAIGLEVPHISAYALTVEAGTALDFFIRKEKLPPVDDDLAVEHFRILQEELGKAAYVHYEISNFSLPGKQSRHNTAYWLGEKYLGVGPSAHSFDGVSRQWNVPNLKAYIRGIADKKPVFEKEILGFKERFNEFVMTSLRTSSGINLEKAKEKFGLAAHNKLIEKAAVFMEREQIIQKDNTLILSSKGKIFADGISAALFTDE